jgi:uncharacterized protein
MMVDTAMPELPLIMEPTVSEAAVRWLFSNLENKNSDIFFRFVSNSVQWTVMGTHPLAGTYRDKQSFLDHTFHRLNRILKDGVRLRITHICVSGTTAVVELEAMSVALNGTPFHNRYCWICRFNGGKIVEVRAYLDSALVQKLLKDNEENVP